MRARLRGRPGPSSQKEKQDVDPGSRCRGSARPAKGARRGAPRGGRSLRCLPGPAEAAAAMHASNGAPASARARSALIAGSSASGCRVATAHDPWGEPGRPASRAEASRAARPPLPRQGKPASMMAVPYKRAARPPTLATRVCHSTGAARRRRRGARRARRVPWTRHGNPRALSCRDRRRPGPRRGGRGAPRGGRAWLPRARRTSPRRARPARRAWPGRDRPARGVPGTLSSSWAA